MIKISHEIPKQLFPIHDQINDFPYVLAHLLFGEHKDEEYATFYKEKLSKSTLSYLDNSLYELGDSINLDILYELGEEYKPSHLILPDKLNDAKGTIEKTLNYLNKYGSKSTPKFMAVAQGETVEALVDCLMYFATIPEIDIIAIPFRLITPEGFSIIVGKPISELTAGESFMFKTLRAWFLTNFLKEKLTDKKIHLLGCHTPSEFLIYTEEEKQQIFSIDTSCPIVYGWNKIKFTETGLDPSIPKPNDKIAEHLDIKLSEEQLEIIKHNITMFRRFC
jgi:hypothetical protein